MSGPSGLKDALGDAARRLGRALVLPPLPPVAVEVRPRAVAAVRLTRDRTALGAAACVDLPEGTLAVSLARPNVNDPITLRSAMRTALERAGALASGPVSLVLPDPAVRLALVPADGVRGRDAEETVRFRLHKSLPFDVRAARLAWRLLPGGQALVAVSPEEVLRGYEEPLETLGLHPGLVEPASLALASALDGAEEAGDRLLVNWDDDYVSFLLLRAGEPVLARTLPGESSPEAVARQAAGTVQFHRDRLGGDGIADVVVRAAAQGREADAVAVLERALGRTPRLVEPWSAVGSTEHGREAQAVAGAAACALRRTA